MRSAQLSYFWFSMPGSVKYFLVRALLLFVLWKVVYHLILFPYHIPDHFLTEVTASGTAWFYSVIFPNAHTMVREEVVQGSNVFSFFINHARVVRIHDACNGLELFVLYLGFLFCIRVSAVKCLSFVLIGIASIFALNVVRCFGLAWLYLHQYSIADFAHHYLFKMVIYSLVFFLWVLYSKKYFKDAAQSLDSSH